MPEIKIRKEGFSTSRACLPFHSALVRYHLQHFFKILVAINFFRRTSSSLRDNREGLLYSQALFTTWKCSFVALLHLCKLAGMCCGIAFTRQQIVFLPHLKIAGKARRCWISESRCLPPEASNCGAYQSNSCCTWSTTEKELTCGFITDHLMVTCQKRFSLKAE